MQWWTRQQLRSKSSETRRQAIEKLASDVTDEGMDYLFSTLQDDDASVRLAVVQALGRLKDSRCLPSLIQAMRDPNAEVREAVVAALMQVGDATCLEVLVGALKDLSSAVRRRAAKALDFLGWKPANDSQRVLRLVALGEFLKAAGIGVLAVEPLLGVLQDPQCPNRRNVVEALSQIGDERVLKPLLGALKDLDWQVRVAAVEALGAIRDPRSVEPLNLALKDQDPAVRAAVADALGKLSDNGSLARLTTSLKDSNWCVRKAAVEALGKLKDSRGVEPLTSLLKDSDRDVREAVVEALGQIRHKSAVEFLVAALTDSQSSIRHAALGVLKRIEPDWPESEAAQRAIPALKTALSSKEYWVRQAAADTLSKINAMPMAEPSLSAFTDPVYYKRTATLQALVQALGDWDRDLRQAAAEALGRLADSRAAEALSEALNDADAWVRHSADEALSRLVLKQGAVKSSAVTAGEECVRASDSAAADRSY